MLLDEGRYEKFAMQAEIMTKESPRRDAVLGILDIGNALGYSKEESLLLALNQANPVG